GVVWSYRKYPPDPLNARRTKRLGIVQHFLDHHAHGQAASLPSTGDEAAPAAFLGFDRIGMEPLGVVEPCIVEHLLLCNDHGPVVDDHAITKLIKFHVSIQKTGQ